MARFRECDRCTRVVSRHARFCPQCGQRQRRRRGGHGMWAFSLFGFFALFGMISTRHSRSGPQPALSPTQVSNDQAEDRTNDDAQDASSHMNERELLEKHRINRN